MKISTICYPKINLCLHVGKKRKDGYHSLISIFQLVKDSPYFDRIEIDINPSDAVKIEVFGLEKYSDNMKNTVYQAAYKYLNTCGLYADLTIKMKKGIPSPSGLGGPASDAAGVLKALNGVYNRLSQKELISLSATIGSDAPFFASDYETAIVEGRGEIITELKTRTDLKYTIVPCSEQKLSTKIAYEMLESRGDVADLPKAEALSEIYYKKISDWNFTNDFKVLYNSLETKKGLYLTGSGPYCFAVENTE